MRATAPALADRGFELDASGSSASNDGHRLFLSKITYRPAPGPSYASEERRWGEKKIGKVICSETLINAKVPAENATIYTNGSGGIRISRESGDVGVADWS